MGSVEFAAKRVFGPVNVDAAGFRMSTSPANLFVTDALASWSCLVTTMLMRRLVVDTRAAALKERCYV